MSPLGGGAETWLMDVYRRIDRSRFAFDFLIHTPRRLEFHDEIERSGQIVFCERVGRSTSGSMGGNSDFWSRRDGPYVQSALNTHTKQRRPGRYQVEAAIAALHDDAASPEETDWPQILAWYDDLVALTDDPVHQSPAAVLGRAVAVAHVRGAAAGLRETERLREVLGERHRWHAVRGHLHELGGDLPAASEAYAEAARRASNVSERDHLVRQSARTRADMH